jgi:hypothetical protein
MTNKEALALALSIRSSAAGLCEQLETYDSYFPDPTFDRVFDALNALDTRMKETRADWEKEMEAEAL